MFNAPKDVMDFLKDLIDLANKNNFQVYIVGGLVRDKLLKVENNKLDVDLLINYDIEKFKALLDFNLKTNLKIRKKFLTASFKTESGSNIDFVQTRKEFYEAPGALPIVSASNFNEDLKRRDFTINTLRVSLSDFLNHGDSLLNHIIANEIALKDVLEKKIRVLHEKSFLDDPTRILRAVKYKVKIQGSYELSTKKLLEKAIDDNYLNYISNYRSLQELLKILSEKEYKEILFEIINLNILLPYFSVKEYKAIIKEDNFKFCNGKIEKLKILSKIVDNNNLVDFLNDLNVSKKERKEILS